MDDLLLGGGFIAFSNDEEVGTKGLEGVSRGES